MKSLIRIKQKIKVNYLREEERLNIIKLLFRRVYWKV